LALCEAGTNRRDLAIARLFVGFAFFRRDDYEKARQLFEQSLTDFRDLKDLYREADTQRQLSDILEAIGEISQSETIAQDLELARQAGERLHLAEVLGDQARWAWENNQFDEAEAHLKEAQSLYDQIGFSASKASLLQGLIAHCRNDYQRARSMYTKFKEQLELLGEKYMTSFVLQTLGALARDEGDLQQAQSYIQQSLKITKEIGSREEVGIRLAWLGQIEFLQGNLVGAKHNFNESLSIAKDVEWRYSKNVPLLTFSNSYANSQPKIAMRVLGAVHAYYRNKIHEPIDPLLTRESDRAIAQARQSLDESAFNAAWAEGKKMEINQAIDYALSEIGEIEKNI